MSIKVDGQRRRFWFVAGLTLVSGLLRSCIAASDWTYDDHHGDSGPSKWKNKYSSCGGDQQSPVDISLPHTKYRKIQDIQFKGYDATSSSTFAYSLINNGHSVQLSVTRGDMRISGAELPGEYKLVQFHVHWGSTNSKGSEHTINGRSYPLEIHFVHYSSDRSNSIGEALAQSDGLAVIGVLAEVGTQNHPVLEKVIEKFCAVKYSGMNTTDVSVFPMIELLPNNRNQFIRYSGSLTTPGCEESVLWTVLTEPIKISQTQLNAFRALGHYSKTYHGDSPLVDNFRPVQPVGTRILLRNYNVVSSGTASSGPCRCAPDGLVFVIWALLLALFVAFRRSFSVAAI